MTQFLLTPPLTILHHWIGLLLNMLLQLWELHQILMPPWIVQWTQTQPMIMIFTMTLLMTTVLTQMPHLATSQICSSYNCRFALWQLCISAPPYIARTHLSHHHQTISILNCIADSGATDHMLPDCDVSQLPSLL